MTAETRTLVIKATGAMARTSRMQNNFKGGMDLMAWAKGPGASAGFVANVYGSSDPGTPQGTGNGIGDGSFITTDDTSKQTLICTLHPTTASVGATGVNAVLLNQICFWDYLFVEFVSLESTTNQLQLTISGRDAA